MKTPSILMCPPDHFAIEYEINPWMNRDRPVDRELARRQWSDLKAIFEQLGVEVRLLEPIAGLPDLVFTANAAMIFRDQAVLARFRHPQRQGEEPVNERWLSSHGFRVSRLPAGHFFEGAGDALFCGDTLFAGYRKRSDARALQEVGQLIGVRVIPMELIDPYYYHLDTCFCPFAPGMASYYPGAFDEYGRKVLQDLVPDLIEVHASEAPSFACNAVVVGRTVVTNTGCPLLHASLNQRGFKTIAIPLGEFVKAGGSAKCLTLRLDGEEGASWKYDSLGASMTAPQAASYAVRGLV